MLSAEAKKRIDKKVLDTFQKIEPLVDPVRVLLTERETPGTGLELKVYASKEDKDLTLHVHGGTVRFELINRIEGIHENPQSSYFYGTVAVEELLKFLDLFW